MKPQVACLSSVSIESTMPASSGRCDGSPAYGIGPLSVNLGASWLIRPTPCATNAIASRCGSFACSSAAIA